MKIQESAENYLEAILMLTQEFGCVHSVDIANKLGFTKPSISIAMKNFRENGYISVDSEGCISLTESGLAIAESVYERHRVLSEALMSLGVDEETAREDACRVEHDLSEQSFKLIKRYFEKEKRQ